MPSNKIIKFQGNGGSPKPPAKSKRFKKQEVALAIEAIYRAYPAAGRRIA